MHLLCDTVSMSTIPVIEHITFNSHIFKFDLIWVVLCLKKFLRHQKKMRKIINVYRKSWILNRSRALKAEKKPLTLWNSFDEDWYYDYIWTQNKWQTKTRQECEQQTAYLDHKTCWEIVDLFFIRCRMIEFFFSFIQFRVYQVIRRGHSNYLTGTTATAVCSQHVAINCLTHFFYFVELCNICFYFRTLLVCGYKSRISFSIWRDSVKGFSMNEWMKRFFAMDRTKRRKRFCHVS